MSRRISRVLIIGERGQVGKALREALGACQMEGADLTTGSGCAHVLDLEAGVLHPEMVRDLIHLTVPDLVINAAAMTNVEACEAEEQRCMLVNGTAAGVVAREAREFGARSIFISTEYIFDGTSGPYGEEEPVSPLSVYGRAKLAAEREVSTADPNSLIVRTTVVYGPEEMGKNFAYQLAARLRNQQPMRVPSDQISSPTYNRDLCRVMLRLAAEGVSGVVNVAGPEVMSRVEFALRIARRIGGDENLIQPCATKDLGQKAARPLQAGLRIDKLTRLVPDHGMRGCEEAVDHWIRNPRGKIWP